MAKIGRKIAGLSQKSDLFLGALILVFIAIILFFSRWIFFHRYDPEYYENWYYHSQWNYPGSTRGISDGILFQFVGYRLVQGENPFNINYELPPLGKYLYGVAERYIGNPYWVSIFLYLASLLGLFLLSRHLLDQRRLLLLALLLFVTTPFVATQVRETMLDLPLMFFYLFHVFLFIKYLSNQSLTYLVASGVFLGLATGTKPGVYTPPAVLLGLLLIFFTTKRQAIRLFDFIPALGRIFPTKRISLQKKFIDLLTYPGAVFAGYVLAYFPSYFIRHPNPIPWLRLHEKPLKFYLGPGGSVDHLNQWKGIFLNLYQGWWEPGKTTVLGDWSPLLPIGVVATVLVLAWALKKQSGEWVYISGLSLVFLGVNSLIPFFPRYLMPAIPLFVVLTVFLLRRFSFLILVLALLNLPSFNSSLAPDGLPGHAEAVARFISTRAYRELYRSINPTQRQELAEETFIELNEAFLEQLGTRDIQVKIGQINKSRGQAKIKYQISYETKYGRVSHEPTLEFVKTHDQWGLVWQWDYLWPAYGPKSRIVIREESTPFLRLEDNRGAVLARRGQGKMVYEIPRLMFDWTKHLNALAEVTGENSLEVDRRIKRVVPDKYPRYVGYLDQALGQEGRDEALSIPGVTLVDIEDAVVSDNASVKDVAKWIKEAREEKPELFYVQAEVYVENERGEKAIIPFTEAEQKDVIIRI